MRLWRILSRLTNVRSSGDGWPESGFGNSRPFKKEYVVVVVRSGAGRIENSISVVDCVVSVLSEGIRV